MSSKTTHSCCFVPVPPLAVAHIFPVGSLILFESLSAFSSTSGSVIPMDCSFLLSGNSHSSPKDFGGSMEFNKFQRVRFAELKRSGSLSHTGEEGRDVRPLSWCSSIPKLCKFPVFFTIRDCLGLCAFARLPMSGVQSLRTPDNPIASRNLA